MSEVQLFASYFVDRRPGHENDPIGYFTQPMTNVADGGRNFGNDVSTFLEFARHLTKSGPAKISLLPFLLRHPDVRRPLLKTILKLVHTRLIPYGSGNPYAYKDLVFKSAIVPTNLYQLPGDESPFHREERRNGILRSFRTIYAGLTNANYLRTRLAAEMVYGASFTYQMQSAKRAMDPDALRKLIEQPSEWDEKIYPLNPQGMINFPASAA